MTCKSRSLGTLAGTPPRTRHSSNVAVTTAPVAMTEWEAMSVATVACAPSAERFQFTVCSPGWLAEQSLPKGFAFLRHTLVVERWDAGLVERAISDLCRRTEGETWDEVAVQRSRFGWWEFEDYQG